MDGWTLAGGSVTGRRHRQLGRNNQDAFCWRESSLATVAVVCDGCGSGAHSEIGAGLGARLVANAMLRQLQRAESDIAGDVAALEPEIVLERTRQEVLKRLRVLSRAMGAREALGECLLFTVVGVWLGRREAIFFALGDGALWINGEEIALGPFPDNAPPYLAYGLLDAATSPRFDIVRRLPMEDLSSFLLGSDGVLDLARAQGCKTPGRATLVAPIADFWEEQRNFANADSVRRTLCGVARDATVRCANNPGEDAHLETGLLPDDTTLIVGRRTAGKDKGGEK